MEYYLNYEWIGGFMILLTCFLVVKDRAFSRRIRAEYLVALISCLILSFVNQRVRQEGVNIDAFTRTAAFSVEAILRPTILLMLIYVSDVWDDKKCVLMSLLLIPDIIFALLGIWPGTLVIFCAYTLLLVATLFIIIKKNDISDYVFAAALLGMIIAAILIEQGLKYTDSFNSALSIITCIYYYYFVMRTYKKDRLTGLLIRHNLNYEMSDLAKKAYDIVLLDVDNFKLINDKYGHERGDAVLVQIVDTVRENLPKECRMYRYGGDEFVVINRKASLETLEASLNRANDVLAQSDLRFSYGIAQHKPGESGEESLNVADLNMYENKRQVKSEDIWDDMTGLFNFAGFLDELDIRRRNLKENSREICLIGIDIERLNSLNMVYGYTEGNAVIAALAKVVKMNLRNNDFAGHLGSDEFALAVECDDKDIGYVNSYIRQIQDGIHTVSDLSDKEYSVRLNTSHMFVSKESDMTSDEYVNNVMYMKREEKETRRRRVVYYDDADYNAEDEKKVMDILDHNRLKYAYQPIVSAKDGSIVAYEALMRSDTEEMVSPLTILSYADRANREYEIEKLSFFNILEDVSKGDFPKEARIFINSIPGYLLTEEDYTLLKEKYGDWFSRLVIEITEQREVNNDALSVIEERRAMDGFNLAIDDYGSGCSNTNSLLRYMPQIVKLDRMLISGLDHNVKKQFFVNSIISFAKENGMLILAEGVETEAECNAVIRLGIDLIQGYYTAKPEFGWRKEIPQNIKDAIVSENLKVGTRNRMVYYANSNCEVSAVHLAMDDYSKLLISSEHVAITGREEYTADLVISIKDGIDTHVKLTDVRLHSVDDEPCISVGEGSNLVLELVGNNQLNAKGIYVPKGSTLTLIGSGNLELNVSGLDCYAIGCDSTGAFGKLDLQATGTMKINLDGETCIGIGGGIATEESPIDICGGYYCMNVAGVDAIGIGAAKGNVSIKMKDLSTAAVFRVNTGIVIGVKNGSVDVSFSAFSLDISGSGTELCGIGGFGEAQGSVRMYAGSFKIKMGGHSMILMGAKSGVVTVGALHMNMDMIGEGDYVLGLGTLDDRGILELEETSLGLILNASNPTAFGVENFNLVNDSIRPGSNIVINGVKKDFGE